jgi:hypothetical protein
MAKLEGNMAAFNSIEVDGSDAIDIKGLGNLLAKMQNPLAVEELTKACNKYDIHDTGNISLTEFMAVVKDCLADHNELKAAMEVIDKVQFGEDLYGVAEDFKFPSREGELFLAMCRLIEDRQQDLENFVGIDVEQTDMLRGVLVKLVQDLVCWDSLDKYPASTQGDEVLKEIANTRGWDWKNSEGKKDFPFADMSDLYKTKMEEHNASKLSGLMVKILTENKTTIDKMSAKFGPRFDRCMIGLLEGLVKWDSKLIDATRIKALDEPAIFAFSFGTGSKIGPALEMATKVGPGHETPGKTNEGLAEAIRKVLQVRPMPVYAQWEIADALLYGGNGHPRPQSFADWNFGDRVEGGDASKRGEWYSREEEYEIPGSGGIKVPVFKSLPTWPLALRSKVVEEAQLGDAKTMSKHYLSTVGVLQQDQNFWTSGLAPKPHSVVVIGHMDHQMRCQKLVKYLMLPAADGGKTTMNLGPAEIPVHTSFPANWSSCGCDKFGYDAKSTQQWTRQRAYFVAHEATARGMQYVREDFGPLPIHEDPEKESDKQNAKLRDTAVVETLKTEN